MRMRQLRMSAGTRFPQNLLTAKRNVNLKQEI